MCTFVAVGHEDGLAGLAELSRPQPLEVLDVTAAPRPQEVVVGWKFRVFEQPLLLEALITDLKEVLKRNMEKFLHQCTRST